MSACGVVSVALSRRRVSTTWAVSELLKISGALTSERDTSKLLEIVLAALCEMTQAQGGRILTLDATQRFLHTAVEQDERKGYGEQHAPVPLYLNNGSRNSRDLLAACAFSGQLLKLGNIRDTAAFDFDERLRREARAGLQTRSMLVAPLSQPEQFSVGVVELFNRRDLRTGEYEPFPDELDALVTMFASQAAVAVSSNRLQAENQRLIQVLDRTNRALAEENAALKYRLRETPRLHGELVGESQAMQVVYELIDKVANSPATVLVQGETGTGKEIVARTIHDKSPRSDKPFVAQNCAALPEQLLESEFFGHAKGAFTGAVADKKGLFEHADGGTLFLDEIGDLPLMLQAKLLRVLQEGEIRPVGSVETRKVDVRILAATHQNLRDKVANDTFREDLFYRLSVFPIELPPLRARDDDLLLVADYFLTQLNNSHGKNIPGFTPRALHALMAYGFPGNVRELRNLIERAVLLADGDGPIDEGQLPQELFIPAEGAGPLRGARRPEAVPMLREAMAEFEAALIERALAACSGNQTEAARVLGISRRGLIDKLKKQAATEPQSEE